MNENNIKTDIQQAIDTSKELVKELEEFLKNKDYKGATYRLNFHISTFDNVHDSLVEDLKLELVNKV